MLKKASEMTEAELREAFEKLEAQREARRARNRARSKAMTPEQKAKRKAYSLAYRQRQAEVRDRATKLGLKGKAASTTTEAATEAVKPQAPAQQAKPKK